MDDHLRGHAHSHRHGHGGHVHVHASVDHLANDIRHGARVSVLLDNALMRQLGVSSGDTIKISTERGRSLVARLGQAGQIEVKPGAIHMDRFARQALKAHLNELIEIERQDLQPLKKVELLPAVDVTMAHDLMPHLKRTMMDQETPVSMGAILYISFPGAAAGTTYEVHKLADAVGYVTDETEVFIHYHDSHLPEGGFDVTFEDVGGLGAQIKLVRELVQLPLKLPHVYRHLGITPPRGIILYGPPGSGKTHLARAVANEVDARFYYINGPDVIGSYTGETEGNLRRMFNEAGHHAPSIIFIDEMDAMAPKRGETGTHSDTRAVTQLLSLMDGLKRVDAVVVIGTTNRVDAIDPAFRRPGRFDREIFMPPPDVAGRREILEIQTREMPLSETAQAFLDHVARRTHGFVGADIMELCRDAGLSALRRSAGDLKDHRSAFNVPVEFLRVEAEDFETALTKTRPSALRETLISIPDVSWDDIGGLADTKRRLKEALEFPLRNPQAMADNGLSPHVGVLLVGPSGTGKTLLAKAVARECGVNFLSVDGPELFSKWLGESEEGVRQIFRTARQVAPAVLFFDQLESIAPIRGSTSGTMTTERVVSQLLAELDGVEPLSGVVVMGATNRLDLIDPSMLRHGRFGAHFMVDLPEESERVEIFRIGLRTKVQRDPSEVDLIATSMAQLTKGYTGAAIMYLCDQAKRLAIVRDGASEPARPLLSDFKQALDSERKPAIQER